MALTLTEAERDKATSRKITPCSTAQTFPNGTKWAGSVGGNGMGELGGLGLAGRGLAMPW